MLIERTDGIEVGVAAGRAAAHWLTPDIDQWGHGYGWTGQAVDAGTLTVVSLVRGTPGKCDWCTSMP
ncbi:hypothetical protein [Streptomyces sp. NPDC093984]|uniref:hypothetical protein n=1 Tax=Streptomyces sp. NPDC093984 TaxID=3366052 RepID=UPI0037F4B329